ncbi:MAG TPA: nucleotidyltransferase domain-containing protein [Thermoanaerobaculia bacterium]|nr:nucleotidyltransferase domain-containing protein [Thermoanaerobaculia bacterium]
MNARKPLPDPSQQTAVDRLADACGADWPHLARGRERAAEARAAFAAAIEGAVPPDASVVVFGSLARDEFSGESDVDWTLLVDGPADPAHLDATHEIGRRADEQGRAPGREGTFGSLAFSHELIHNIGGEDDTNSNTTRRILLLLESAPIGPREAYDRVLAGVLHRYLDEDRGLWTGSGRAKVPRFLLNDISRYWRTMLVDFAYKQRSRAGRGWALRNIKLRLSRKLIFLSGLLTCFSPVLDLGDEEIEAIFGAEACASGDGLGRLARHLRAVIERPPLETVAAALLAEGGDREAACELFAAYEDFLALISDDAGRRELSELTYDRLEGSPAFTAGRRIAGRFQQAVQRLFLAGDGPLTRLTIDHGIF